MAVYAEAVLGLNFLMDYVLLWLAGTSLGQRVRAGRLALASLLGAAYALLYLLPRFAWTGLLPCRLAVAVAMVEVAYRPRRAPVLAGLTGAFCLGSMAVAGAALAVACARLAGAAGAGPSAGVALSPAALPAGLAVGAFLALCGGTLLARAAGRRASRLTLTVVLGRRQASFAAVVDTANELREPLTNLPVMVAELGALSPILPLALCRRLEAADPRVAGALDAAALDAVALGAAAPGAAVPGNGRRSGAGRMTRTCLVPFRVLGSGGLLFGFHPDAVVVDGLPGGRRSLDGLIVAVYPRALARHGDYQALLPAALIA